VELNPKEPRVRSRLASGSGNGRGSTRFSVGREGPVSRENARGAICSPEGVPAIPRLPSHQEGANAFEPEMDLVDSPCIDAT